MTGTGRFWGIIGYIAGAAIALGGIGCGRDSGPPLVDITGTLSRHGEPLAGYGLQFIPESGRPSDAVTDAKGQYRLQYTADRAGAVLGRHRVIITSYQTTDNELQAAIDEGRYRDIPPEIGAVLKRYGDLNTTPLQFEISERQVLDIELD